MAKMKLIPSDVLVDEVWGETGTPKRDRMEAQLKEEVEAYEVGEAIRKARLSQNLTQEQLGQKIGVQKSQISKFERGKSITLTSMTRIFKALGINTAFLDLGEMGRVALW